MSKRWRLLGSAVLLGALAFRLDWVQLAGAFAGLDVRAWGLATGVLLTAQLVSGFRWRLLAAPLGLDAPYHRLVAYYFIGMFFNLLLPTSVGGDVVRGYYLANGRRRSDALLSVFVERGSGLSVLILMACVAGLAAPVAMPGWMTAIVVVLSLGTVTGLMLLPLAPLACRLPWIGRRVGQLVTSSRVYLGCPGTLVVATLLSVLVQLGSVAQFWLIARGLGLDVTFAYLAVVVPLATLLTLVPVSINGMGLRELGLVTLLAPVGVAPAHAVTLSLLYLASCVLVSLVGLAFYLRGQAPRVLDGNVDPMARSEGRCDAEPVGGDSDQGRTRQSATAA